MDKFARWPLLLASAVFTSAAIGLDLTSPTSSYMVVVLFVMAAITLGAFIYAEGARHREWLGHLFDRTTGEDHPESPGALPDEKE
jgi:hypothetical protein